MTNAEKFKEVFGKAPITGNKPFVCNSMCLMCKYNESECKTYDLASRCHAWDWWNEEYDR